MTCIVGLRDSGRVLLGGDSLCTEEDVATLLATPKVFTHNGLVVGIAGSLRYSQIVRYDADLPRFTGGDPDAFMVNEFVPVIADAARKAGVGTKNTDSELLVGVAGVLFHVDCALAVTRPRDNYMAIGSGSNLALGSMHGSDWMEPRVRIRRALRAAEHFSITVAGPFRLAVA